MITIRAEDVNNLSAYASISIAFTVREVVDPVVVPEPHRAAELRTREVAVPYVKNYDQPEGHGPLAWSSHFDMTRWGILAAFVGEERAGGATIIAHDAGVELLEDRRDLALLWDLRVAPGFRRTGVGTTLVAAAEQWARARHARELKVETQNINAPACRFYQRCGFTLGAANKGVYDSQPDEVQLLWYKRLAE